jgi:hypothetical protein
MPLTKKGRKLKGLFMEEYGKRRGQRIFYAFENKHKGMVKK